MRILLTNDDGIHAEGLHALYRRFSREHEVLVVAPDRERSAVGHSITLHKPLRCDPVTLEAGVCGYAVNGTPADCVKLAVLELMVPPPDLVLSGINPGANIGFNVNYSGTVCAAREAGYYSIPAIAVSMTGDGAPYVDDAAAFLEQVVRQMEEQPLPRGIV
ncbi:MAG: 5'/3'-nucleotidase SurE, partial [Deltaproteobacteria bacterium]|nr:5'/3'-nucleotidase SurE [Deltaproteobacteria bacterium]